jgi:hypothetical protein
VVVFLVVTHAIFPSQYFPNYNAYPYNGTYFTYLPTVTTPISNGEILQKSSNLEFNWLVLSPWPAYHLMDQKINCYGSFWTCPQADQFANFLPFAIGYILLFGMLIYGKSKYKYAVLGFLIIGSGLLGLKMTDRYVYQPLQLQNNLLQRFSVVSKAAPFPDGTKIVFPAKYEDRDGEIQVGVKQSDQYISLSLFNVSQDDKRFKDIVNGKEFCADNKANIKTKIIGNNVYLCQFTASDGTGKIGTVSAAYGFLDPDRKIFFWSAGHVSESNNEFNSSINAFLNFYHITANL